MVILCIYTSVATLEAYTSESGMETNCYKYKTNTIEINLEWFLTTRTVATTPRISIFTLSLLKTRAFFWMLPNVCFLISRTWKKIPTNGFHHFKLHPQEKLILEYKRYRRKIGYWKIVANENCTAVFGVFSSVKILFWVNHASQKARNILKRKIHGWTDVPKKVNWLYWIISENWGRNGQKTLKIASNRQKSKFFAY